MISLPTDHKQLVTTTLELAEQCRVSVPMRAAYCQSLNYVAETGRADGTKSLINLLNVHLARTAAHIFSPIELKFSVDYDREYGKKEIDRAKVVGKQITRQWDRSSTDILFGRGVFESLKYGACILKQWVQEEGKERKPHYYAKLIMPWQFGVYNEYENDISKQPVLCETTSMTLPEVWRRIWYLPNAKELFNRVVGNAQKGQVINEGSSNFLQVLSTSTLQTPASGGGATIPGGMVNLNSAPNYAVMSPQVAAATVQVHELWVQDDEDYTTLLLIEPDILISPPVMDGKMIKKSNLLGIPCLQPYSLIQVNERTNYFWGRSELVDMVEPQMFLSMNCDDMRRLIGVQVDKILFFIGEGGLPDEKYGQMRMAGFGTLDPNTKIEDMTPEFPPHLLEIIKFNIETLHQIGAFPPIMQGQGEAGVRAGTHAGTLLKTGSPTLRDRSLIAERQCAIAADKTLTIKEAKDDSKYWTNGENIDTIRDTEFILNDLPEDWRVTVDSHSSSPIFADENAQLIMAAASKGWVQTEYVVDNLPFPNKEAAKAQNREAEKKKSEFLQNLLQSNPEMGEKLAFKQIAGGKR